MILQYLQDEGYNSSVMTVQDEAQVMLADQQIHRGQLKRVRNAILGVPADMHMLDMLPDVASVDAVGMSMRAQVPRHQV